MSRIAGTTRIRAVSPRESSGSDGSRGGQRVRPVPLQPLPRLACGEAVDRVPAEVADDVRWVFAWALVDKLFGLGRATPAGKGRLDGGSPTEGFLANAPTGPFAGLYNGLAGAAWRTGCS